jgi:hypothetical protein
MEKRDLGNNTSAKKLKPGKGRNGPKPHGRAGFHLALVDRLATSVLVAN